VFNSETSTAKTRQRCFDQPWFEHHFRGFAESIHFPRHAKGFKRFADTAWINNYRSHINLLDPLSD